jgi:hypothetical protein
MLKEYITNSILAASLKTKRLAVLHILFLASQTLGSLASKNGIESGIVAKPNKLKNRQRISAKRLRHGYSLTAVILSKTSIQTVDCHVKPTSH